MKFFRLVILHTAILLGTWIFLLTSPVYSKTVPPSSCVKCHSDLGGEYAKPVKLLEESIHVEKEVACHNCHGGDPKTFDEEKSMSKVKGFVGRPGFKEIPEFCARCHSNVILMRQYNLRTDQLAQYKTSYHGKLLYSKGDKNAATCNSCHGVHDIKKKENPLSMVYKTNLPRTCAKCHSDTKLMEKYKLPSNQFDLYQASIHGKMLMERNDLRAPGCADCHGIHGATPPGYAEIANVCASCHSSIADLFKQSPHYAEKTKVHMARCVDCHGSHDVSHPTTDLYVGTGERHCGGCHGPDSKQVRLGLLLKKKIDDTILLVEQAKKAIERIRYSGKSIIKIEEAFEVSRSELVKARAATHTLNMDKVEENAKKANEKASEVLQSINQIRQELEGRKREVIFVLVVLGLIIVIVSLYYLRAKHQWMEGTVKGSMK
ncbi:MAG: cytochrome c3 family protein [Thermodesulfobacteriota bacterium]